MFSKYIFTIIIVFVASFTPTYVEITFIRPGEKPAERSQFPDVSGFDLATIYRGIDLLGRVRPPTSRGAIENALSNALASDELDGHPGITDDDRVLAAQVEIARARSMALRIWTENDLDNNRVVTREELVVVGRTKIESNASRRRLGSKIKLTDGQRQSLVLEFVAKGLRRDLDGDNRVTYEEAISGVNEDRILTRRRAEGSSIKPIWDVNDDGKIAEVEVRLEADRLLDFIDANSDNVVDTEEANTVRKAFIGARAKAGDRSGGRRVKCELPQIPAIAEIAVIQGNAGTAVTNLAFDIPNDPVVRMAEISIPSGHKDIYLIASMRSPTVFRVVGPGAGRVKAVIGVASTVALDGGNAKLANTSCHRGFLGMRIGKPGGIAKEFGQVLGRTDLTAIVGGRIGRVDLGALTNDAETVLSKDALPIMQGDGQFIVDRFMSFDPGGFQILDPSSIRSTVAIRERETPPLEIGLIVLASKGKVDFVAPPPEFLTRKVPEGVKRVVPDSKSTEGVIWEQMPDGGAKARFPLTVVVRTAIDLPAGLTTERGVRLIVPEGVPAPRGAKKW
ncbi:EF-hand domain-containing protein [Aliiroseovarius sp. KMU-50]|uniref:EF-hand domain-containing protein n=1 Tax=Aliiroseovarius salicola TaxID=3009082 RepID=A0ABT4W574_9RHOB|nr:EF-hand domain-containing protein [Aliiroseovarius sp. KMU-50]MDA5095539.1 EF-hand domain-containing protein [Aliiroseovarius sp. KMU-50]